MLFRAPLAVLRGGIEVIDAAVERERHRGALLGVLAADHQPADAAAPEADRRYSQPRAAEVAVLHAPLLASSSPRCRARACGSPAAAIRRRGKASSGRPPLPARRAGRGAP